LVCVGGNGEKEQSGAGLHGRPARFLG